MNGALEFQGIFKNSHFSVQISLGISEKFLDSDLAHFVSLDPLESETIEKPAFKMPFY